MSNYNDNEYQFVAVLNSKVEFPKLLNALGHMTAGLISLQKNIPEMKFLEYIDGSGTIHPAISTFPFIILKSKNGNQIRRLRESARESGILYNDFTDTMLGSSANDQLNQTLSKKETELSYFGICLFGSSNDIKPMTKRFSLFNSSCGK